MYISVAFSTFTMLLQLSPPSRSRTLSFVAVPRGLQDLSSLTRDRTRAPAVKVLSPNHWTAREFPRTFSSPQNKTISINSHSPFPFSCSPWQPVVYCLSLWIYLFWTLHIAGMIEYVDLPFLDTSYSWNDRIFGFLCLASFT